MTGEFPAHRASNAENVSIWWRHHDLVINVPYIRSLYFSQCPSKFNDDSFPLYMLALFQPMFFLNLMMTHPILIIYARFIPANVLLNSMMTHPVRYWVPWTLVFVFFTLSQGKFSSHVSSYFCEKTPPSTNLWMWSLIHALMSMLFNSSPLDKMAAISQAIFSNAFFLNGKICTLIKISLNFVP